MINDAVHWLLVPLMYFMKREMVWNTTTLAQLYLYILFNLVIYSSTQTHNAVIGIKSYHII